MVVRELQYIHYLIGIAQVSAQRGVVRNAAEKDDSLGIIVARVGFPGPYGHVRIIVHGGEEQRLATVQTECLPPFRLLVLFHLVRALGHYHHVGVGDAGRQVPEPPEREETVLENGAFVIHQHDVERRVEFLVLEGVVQHDDVRPVRDQIPAPFHPVLVDRHFHLRELALDLQGFIPCERGRTVSHYLLIPLALALVAAGQHRQPRLGAQFLQKPQYHLRMRRLPRPAYGYISHADGGDLRSWSFSPGPGGTFKNQALYQHSVQRYCRVWNKVRPRPAS